MIRQQELQKIGNLIEDVLQPGHFFVRPGMDLLCQCAGEETPWELFRGRLLPPQHARETRHFQAWSIYHVHDGQRSAEPILSIKVDAEAGRLHVVRSILSYVWEGYDAGDNVIESRETTRWLPELVGSIALAEFRDDGALRVEISRLVTEAFVGTSRLPLTSVESPLPGFSLGHFAFFDLVDSATSTSHRTCQDLLERCFHARLGDAAMPRLLEVIFRAADREEIPNLASVFAERWTGAGNSPRSLMKLLRILFNETSLTPWTGMVDNFLTFLRCLVDRGIVGHEDRANFLAHLLCQLGRHLTAYDLITFHHRGANYPDALLLETCLKEFLRTIEQHPQLFEGPAGRLRRRALRQAWLLRAYYEGHVVPDAPTSPGENARLLPEPHRRVPEEQILQSGRRRKCLYDGDPLSLPENSRLALRQSLHDLQHPDELLELGLGVFIDRPLSAGKAPGEPDRTPLLSYLAFSRTIAARRLHELERPARDTGLELDYQALQKRLADLPVHGLAVNQVHANPNAVVSLADACRAADDFVLLKTLHTSLRPFVELFDWKALADHTSLDLLQDKVLIAPIATTDAGFPVLGVFDDEMKKRFELVVDLSQGYLHRGGVEVPRAGLLARGHKEGWQHIAMPLS